MLVDLVEALGRHDSDDDKEDEEEAGGSKDKEKEKVMMCQQHGLRAQFLHFYFRFRVPKR